MANAKIFTYDLPAANGFAAYNSRSTNSYLTHLWSMGFEGQEYLNNKTAPIYSVFPTSDIVVINHHGNPGNMLACDTYNSLTYLYANSGSFVGSNDRAIASLSSGQLSDVEVVIYGGCKAAIVHPTLGGLVNITAEKGTKACVGWNVDVYTEDVSKWVTKVFYYCNQGKSFGSAMIAADQALNGALLDSDGISNHRFQTGSMNLYNLYLKQF